MQAAKNFQSQLAEKKSIAVARGYHPLSLPPSHAASSRLLVGESVPLSKPMKPDKKAVTNSIESHAHPEKAQVSLKADDGSRVSWAESGAEHGDKGVTGGESSRDSSKSQSLPVARNVSI